MIAVSLAGILIRLYFRDFISRDMRLFLLPWYSEIKSLDLKQALSTQIGNYNMLYQQLICLLTRLPGAAIYKYKVLSIIFDYLLALGVYAFVYRLSDYRRALAAYAAVLMLPTAFLNSAVWGQCDSMYTAFIIWALFFLYDGRTALSFAFLGIALSCKLQTVFIFPFIGFYCLMCAERKSVRIRPRHIALLIVFFIVPALPSLIAGRSVTELFTVYFNQTETYKNMYLNYPSIWSIIRLQFGADKSWCIGITFILLITLMLWFRSKNADAADRHFLWCAFILSYTCVLFLPAMHERYSFLYEILALVLVFGTGRYLPVLIVIELITLKTYLYYLYQTPLSMEFLAVVNLLVYLWTLRQFGKELNGEEPGVSLLARRKNDDDIVKCSVFSETCSLKVSRCDIKAMLAITFVFLIFGSMHLGRIDSPQTSEYIGTKTELGNEIYISFAGREELDQLCIFTRSPEKKTFKVFYENDGEWIRNKEDIELSYLHSWAKLRMDTATSQLCLITDEEEAEVTEIACVNKNGDLIRLINDKTPERLIDEQDCLSGYPTGFDGMIFDEVYHGRTAYEFLNGSAIYENTHPPLGKILISAGIRLFGMNPFGYRIVSLLFGTLLIPLMYLFALRITGRTVFAAAAGVFQATEFMHYTLSRIATIDVIVAFFIIGMFYGAFAFLQEKRYRHLVLSGTAFAFGCATKWTALYAAPAVGILLLSVILKELRAYHTSEKEDHFRIVPSAEKPGMKLLKLIGLCVVCFILVPACVYILSYIPFARVYTDKNILQHAVSNSISMLSYHQNVTEPHPYESNWYTWLLDLVPLCDYRMEADAVKSTISTFVNPFICFAGLASVFHHIYLTKHKDKTSAVLLLMYLSMLVPWMFIARTVFIYQYFVCTKILILMICNSIRCLGFVDENRVLKVSAGISAALFAAYLPVISGVLFSSWYINGILKLLPKWYF